MALAALADAAIKPAQDQENNLGEFLAALTELSRQYGIGIAGEPVLYLVEEEDRAFVYECDEQSNLTLT